MFTVDLLSQNHLTVCLTLTVNYIVRKPDQKNYPYFSKYKPCVEEGKMLLRTVSEHSWGLELFVCFGDILNKQELLDNNVYG